MHEPNSLGFGLLIIGPGIIGIVASVYFFRKYEHSRRGQPLKKRIFGDLLGPFSLVVARAESKESRPLLLRGYLCGAFVVAYVSLLFCLFA